MRGNPVSKPEESNSKLSSRRRVLSRMGATGIGVLSSTTLLSKWTGVGRTAELCTTEVGTSCSSGSYPIQDYKHDDPSNGDLVSGVSEFEAYGSDAVDNWKIPIEVSSNASRPFCDCGTADEIKWSSITFNWDSTEGDVYSNDNDQYVGASHESLAESSYDYENYADTAVDYGVGKLLNLVPYAGELKAASEILYAMYHDVFVEEDTTETWKTGFDWKNTIYEINQVSYWNKAEAILAPDASMTIDINDETDSDKISDHALQNNFSWTVYAPSDSPSSSTVLSGEKTNDWTYMSVDRAAVEDNPQAYGLSKSRLEQLPGGTITFARRKGPIPSPMEKITGQP